MNYYFMSVSEFVLTIVGTWVTEKVIEPRLGTYKGEINEGIERLMPEEKKGLWGAFILC
jgi:aminobenzoyl-glutamate transport protein